ncbi:MAG: PAS domain S-box protein [Syntrophomonadaceae bacterium]
METEKLKVLLIEDNLGDARLISEMISDVAGAKIQIDHAFRLSTGLERLAKCRFDAILLDLTLPDSTGLDTLRKVHARAGSVPIIIMTYNEGEEIGLKAMQIGAQDYLIKLQIDGVLLVRSLRYAIERKKSEEKLNESEDRFRATFELAAVGIAHVDLSGKWIRVNQKFCSMMGYSVYELLLLSVDDVTYPADIQTDRELKNKILSGEIKSYTLEKRFLRKDGSVLWVSLTASLFCDQNGEAKYFIIVTEDITERKYSERKHSEAIQLLNSIIEHINMLYIKMDAQFNILEVNPAFARMSGGKPGDFAGRNFFTIFPEPSNRTIFEQALEKAESSSYYGKPLSFPQEQDNNIHYWDFNLIPITDEGGNVTAMTLTLLDVTDRMKLSSI